MQKSIIYCRVSSEKQRQEGKGLESQEHRCRGFAKKEGYDIEQVFQDSFSGGGDFMKRPAMKSLLEYLDNHPTEKYVVIFDDLKRFARDTVFHWNLRRVLETYEAIPKCLNFNFEDTPEGEFIETIMAAQGELERKQNQRQVCQKMKARMERGYWCFHQPPAYKFEKNPVHGKLLVPQEPQASILREALELYADEVLITQKDFMNFLIQKDFKTQRGGNLNLETCKRMLTQTLYSGYIEYPKWKVRRQKAHHEGLISLATFEKIQKNLKKKGKAKARKDLHMDFPLRGYAVCETCQTLMTSSWSTGKYRKFPYYRCKNRACTEYGKGIRKEKIEDDVEALLKKMKPSKGVLELLKVIVLEVWKTKMVDVESGKGKKQKRLAEIKKDQKNLLTDIRKASNEIVRRAFEDEVVELDKERQLLESAVARTDTRNFDFEKGLELVLSFIENPYQIWINGDFEEKRMVLNLVFPKGVSYDRKQGVGTPELSLPFRLTRQSSTRKIDLVEVARVELASKEEIYNLLRS